MFKRKSLLLLFPGLIAIEANTQQNHFSISASPVVLSLPDISSGLQTGIHYYFKENWSASSEIALPFSKHEDSLRTDKKYFRLGLELKYFKRTYSDKSSTYIAISSFFIQRSYEAPKGGVYYKEKDPFSYEFNKAKISSPVFTIVPKFGVEINVSPVKVDLFAGAGLRIVATSYKNVEGLNSMSSIKRICKIFPSPDPAHWFNETLFRPQFSAGMRLHFMFNEK